MRELPILFSAPMVRAVLDGTKTQTRRVMKNVPSWQHFGKDIMDWDLSGIHQEGYGEHDQLQGTDRWYLDVQTDVDDHSRKVIRCPYGQPGDRLWVRETWGTGCRPDPFEGWRDGIEYRADIRPDDDERDLLPLHRVEPPEDVCLADLRSGWRPSIHMPRWASRITLEVTSVRVERLQAISDADEEAEGTEFCPQCGGCGWINSGPDGGWQCEAEGCGESKYWYRRLWESLNGAGSWDANPWVWVISFRRVTP